MSHAYTWVTWNAHKRRYDALLAGGVVLYLVLFVAAERLTARHSEALSAPVLAMRALGSAALILLHLILCIGPLARMDRRFAALLYNRRHMGVTMFLLALAHALIAVFYYGGFAGTNPLPALLGGYGPGSVAGFPFEWLGFAALLVLFLMAATSHDFWLANLTPAVWKWLHMLVYPAYAAAVLHTALGALQSERSPVYVALMGAGLLVVAGLHIAAGRLERKRDRRERTAVPGPREGAEVAWAKVGTVDEIPEGRAKTVCLAGGNRVAIFRHEGKLSAVSNVCAHQGGPLGEGKVVGGCITCPWHGYQYLPESGQSPPPYTEKIATYEVRIQGRCILLNPEARAPGTPVAPVLIESRPPARAAEVTADA